MLSSDIILIIEDYEPLLRFSCKALGHCGYHCLAAKNAAEAMQLFAAEHAIVLVITDLRFSRQGEALEGYVLAEGFRKLRPHLKVLYTTGSGPHEVDVHGAPFLHKPFSVQELLTAVHTVLLGPQIS